MEKKSILLYLDYKEHLTLLPDAERGRLLLALFDYAETGAEPAVEGMAKMAFSFIRAQMDRDAQKYSARCEQNRANGAKGERPRKAGPPAGPLETGRFPEEPGEPDTEEETEQDQETEEETDQDTDQGTGSTAVFYLPLLDKSRYRITEGMVREWGALYPAVDIMQDLRGMKGWLDANPGKRKTRRGILRFITGWLARTQDRGGNRPQDARRQGTGNVFADLALEMEGDEF